MYLKTQKTQIERFNFFKGHEELSELYCIYLTNADRNIRDLRWNSAIPTDLPCLEKIL